jgi:hypothetical protein
MRFATLLVALLLAAIAIAAPARAQDSPAQLRQQIDRLTEQIAELEAEVERANERIEKLLDENRRLREALRAGGGANNGAREDEATEEEAEVQIPDDPFAAPIAMRRYVERKWQEEFGDLTVSEGDVDTDYLRSVRRWSRDVQRDLNDEFTWRVYVHRAEDRGRRTVAEVQVLNPAGYPLGDRVEIEATGLAGRLLLAAASDAVILVDGRMRVQLDVSVQHGAGDDLVAPYVMIEADYDVRRARYE